MAAVDEQFCAGHEGCRLTGQEQNTCRLRVRKSRLERGLCLLAATPSKTKARNQYGNTETAIDLRDDFDNMICRIGMTAEVHCDLVCRSMRIVAS